MRNTLSFEIPGTPVGQGRPRFTTINGHAKAYDPEKSQNYKAYVRMIATQAMQAIDFKMIEGACSIVIMAFFEVPKSKSKKFKLAALNNKEWPTKKPDVDNIAKAIQDALNGLVYKDDSNIVYMSVSKYYNTNPKVLVKVWEEKEGE